jgi:hypothetical protein
MLLSMKCELYIKERRKFTTSLAKFKRPELNDVDLVWSSVFNL